MTDRVADWNRELGLERGLGLRLSEPRDRSFLVGVYRSTREPELAVTDWTDEQKQAFVEMQFTAQDSYWREHYEGAQFLVLERDGEPIGRIYLFERDRELRLMDIAILPAARRQGLGGHVLERLQASCARAGKALSIHVEQFNPALGLYERLGFQRKSEAGAYFLLEWHPPSAGS